MAEIIAELENAALMLLSPPNVMSNQGRHTAEETFLKFRKSKTPFALCRHILETSKNDYVLFQTASLLKEALIREWPTLDKSDVQGLRAYLFQYILHHTSLANYVREQLLQVISIVIKRGGVEGAADCREETLVEVSRLIFSGDITLQTVGCSVLSSLLTEYANTIRSSDIGLTWETHYRAKKDLETADLKRIFQFCVRVLAELEQAQLTAALLSLLARFLAIAEQILNWNFIYSNLPRKVVGIFEADQFPYLGPGPSWRDTILDRNVIELFFKVYFKIRGEQDVAHHALNCLIQLASLHGTVFVNMDARLQYLTFFIQNLLRLLTAGDILEHEVVGFANTLHKLVMFFPSSVMGLLPDEILNSFLERLTSLTCHYSRAAAQEEALHKDNQVYMEGFERLLETWLAVLRDGELYPDKYAAFTAATVFDTYLQCHLAPPDGTRMDNEDEEDFNECSDSDHVLYRDQLSIVGMIGRKSLKQNVPLLTRLLESRTDALQQALEQIHQGMSSNGVNGEFSTLLSQLYEDIHWLVLLTGHLIAMEAEGEASLVPAEVMHYAISNAHYVDLEVTLKVVRGPEVRAADVAGSDKCDPVVRLTAAVFRLCELEKRAVASRMACVLSPQVGATLVWFLSLWSRSYLLPNETYYTEMCKSLQAAFGRDTEAGRWTLEFLLDKISSNLAHWSSESALIDATIQMLVALVENRDRCVEMLKCHSLWRILRQQAIENLTQLPRSAKRNLLKALVITCSALPPSAADTCEPLLVDVLNPLQQRFRALICQHNFARIYHEHQVRTEMIHLLESFTGVAQGCDGSNSHQMFTYLAPILSECVGVMNVYHNYQDVVELILELFCETTNRLLCFLLAAQSQNLYGSCLSMLQTFAKFNAGKQSRECNAEEDQYRDVLLIMKLLTNLLSKDFLDLTPHDQGEGPPATSASDIALLGLNIIMPLMNAELLKFPRLCLHYFKMVTFVCEIYPEKICNLPEDLLRNLFGSIQLAFNHLGTEIITLCLDFLTVLCAYMYRCEQQSTLAFALSRPFLKVILDMVLMQTTDSDITVTASGTIFALICCYQDHYQEIVQSLLQAQTDPVYYQRLLAAFNRLSVGVAFVENRPNRLKFRDNFEKFIVDVRGFLCVK